MGLRRIALMFEYSTLNGGERSMLAAADWLQTNDRRFEFVAIAPGRGRLAEALGARRIPVIDWSITDADGERLDHHQILTALRSSFEATRADLLHANSLAMGRLTGRLAGSSSIPTTTHLRDIINLSATAIADLNSNRTLIAVSTATQDFHVAQGVDDRRVVVVRNGVDLEQFQPRPATGWLCRELGIATSAIENIRQSDQSLLAPKLVAAIGQIGLRKGQNVLAAAAPTVLASVPDVHFVLVGERTSQKPESIEFEHSIHEAFADAGLSERLHMLGNRDDVPQILNEVCLLVHPANQEPYGRVLLEATASGVPIVATDVGGTSEIVADQETGLLIPPKDPRTLARAVIEMLTDQTKAGRFRSAARCRALEAFSIASAAQKLGDVWSDVLG